MFRLRVVSGSVVSHLRAPATRHARLFNFASKKFVQALTPIPKPDAQKIRAQAVEAAAAFQSQTWYDDPICSVVLGRPLAGGEVIPTFDAFGRENGRQIVSTEEQIDGIISHILNYRPPQTDLRAPLRLIEQTLFTQHAGTLIANQAMDFHKQDGVTEIEEAIQAGTVEAKLNDQLWEEERSGAITILREPAFVGCVSNFSNFLDLGRKTIRNIELGVPVVVLSRSNTTQHMYRWFQLLQTELDKAGVCSGMLTYASATVAQQRRIFKQCSKSPLYLTGSRPIAAAIKELLPNTFASTGGPNTMVCLDYTPNTAKAVQLSATIENSGQCTALRHLVTSCSLTPNDIEKTFAGVEVVESSVEALRRGSFAGLLPQHPFKPESGYTVYKPDPKASVAYRIADKFPVEVDECWRRVFLDVTNVTDMRSEASINALSAWLNKNQPISLAVNGDVSPYPVARKLFERSALCVYTVGAPSALALTAQARPQEGEVFGEVPPRGQFSQFSKFPVFVPSSTPGYNAQYTPSHLQATATHRPDCDSEIENLWSLNISTETRGYLNILASYLKDACGPRRGYGARTSLFGLQRPPLDGSITAVLCNPNTSLDQAVVCALPYLATNARHQTVFVFDNAEHIAAALAPILDARGVSYTNSLANLSSPVFNCVLPHQVVPRMSELPLAGHLVTTLLSYGHIKSTLSNDQAFYDVFEKSAKWLRVE
eukprot:c126_g1_i1.p1 GENE.c126_g1_i1~~c126_g1_i1.p1  ORF type:complete len:722 (+),score=141.26 c126_g1_i1:32-2167(+)